MNTEASNRQRLGLLILAALVTAASLLLLGPSASAEAKTSKLPLLYKGNGYKLEPGLMYGWDPDGFGKPLRYLGKSYVNDPAGTALKWTTWNETKAVGTGLARSSGCVSGGEGDECEVGYPWNWTKMKVVAWRPVSGHFTRMKIFTPIPQSDTRFYELFLAFRGPVVPLKTVSWKTVRTVRS